MMASKDGYDRSFLIAVVGDRLPDYRPNDGWRLTKINDDPVWKPAGFFGKATVLVNGRYFVYVASASGSSITTQLQMTVFDTQTSTFNALLPVPNDVLYFGNAPWSVGEHAIEIVVGRQITMAANRITGGSLFLRRIDLVTGGYEDVPFDDSVTTKDIEPDVSQSGQYLIGLSVDGVRPSVANGVAHLYRQPPYLAQTFVDLVDGVVQTRSRISATDPYLYRFRDVAEKEDIAILPIWRRVAMQGWSGRVGYFEAAPADDKIDLKFGPTVFDAANESWDFVFSDQPLILDDRQFDITMFVVGVVPPAR
jgi:hypothetical protein